MVKRDPKLYPDNQNGGIYVMTLIITMTLLVLGISLLQILSVNFNTLRKDIFSIKALYLAEAGIEKAIIDTLLNDPNKDWADNQFTQVYEKEKLGDGYFSVSLKHANSKSIIISASGKIYNTLEDVNVLLAVNWKKTPPQITHFIWQKENIDSLSLIY